MNGRQDDSPAQAGQAVGQQPLPPTQSTGRKKGTACVRCRSQKIRCDDCRPSCTNCARVGQPCVRTGRANDALYARHLTQVETRLRWLEESLRRLAPEELDKAPAASHVESFQAPGSLSDGANWPRQNPQPVQQRSAPEFSREVFRIDNSLDSSYHVPSPTSAHTATDSPTNSIQIGPGEPLAHEVGLLSLANSKESKYLGPSSGVPLARLIFSAVPQSQGLATTWAVPPETTRQQAEVQPFPPDWTSEVDLQHFFDAYFQTYQPLYPFLDEDAVADCFEALFAKQQHSLNSSQMPQLSEVEAVLSPTQCVQIFLVLALGARILEARLSVDLSSQRYFATAMRRIDSLVLHDSIEGLQIKLLLALSGLCFENGPNAWYLTSSIIASCLDLGLQRRWIYTRVGMSSTDQAKLLTLKNIRRGVFWSAYSLERMLAVALGRPLTLRDEAIDVEFPRDDDQASETPPNSVPGVDDAQSTRQPSKKSRLSVSSYTASRYSFRFDQMTAEMKLMLYRVVNLPDRFPWPTNFSTWQGDIHKRCDHLLESLLRDLKWRSRSDSSNATLRSLELKYHHCLMILHRPSPAIPRPTVESWKTCYNSSVKTILINAELHRFSKLTNSWLTAHTVFVSGITFLYCLWIRPEIKAETSFDTFTNNAAACVSLLKFLGKMWSVASHAVGKFESLVQLTTHTWRAELVEPIPEVSAGRSLMSIMQARYNYNTGQDRSGDYSVGMENFAGNADEANLGDIFASIGRGTEWEREAFFNELGDMTSWFDLDWIPNAPDNDEGPTFPII